MSLDINRIRALLDVNVDIPPCNTLEIQVNLSEFDLNIEYKSFDFHSQDPQSHKEIDFQKFNDLNIKLHDIDVKLSTLKEFKDRCDQVSQFVFDKSQDY